MTFIKKISDSISLSSVYSFFCHEKDTVFLESSLVNNLGRYSILARRPYLKIEKNCGKLFVNGQEREMDFTAYVKQYMKENQTENPTGLPIVSGAIGYFSYNFYNVYQNSVDVSQKIPESILIFYDEFVIEDHMRREIYLVENGKTMDPQKAWEKFMQTIISDACLGKTHGQQTLDCKPEISYDFTREEYVDAIERLISYIRAGDVYVANMTQRMFIKSKMQPWELYQKMQKDNPSPFGAYLNYGDFQVVCASPERFMQVKDGVIITRPIKGTRKRGKTKEEDLQLKQELENSVKDKSELLMIVDLERNDLNKICELGSVCVDNLFSVESYATVHHLIAEVKGKLRQEIDFMDVLNATFPGGSITGAPKLRAMEILDELEHTQRGLYTGTIGYFSLNGDCDMNIVIRTAVFQNGIYTLGIGGGITCESEPQKEYEETLQKAKAFRIAFEGE